MDFHERDFLCCSNERIAKDGVSVFFRARRSFIAISIFMWIFRFISGISLAKRLSTLRNINVVSEDCIVTSTYVSISRCPAIFSLAFIFRPFVQCSSTNFHWKYICLPLQYNLDTCIGCKGFKNAYKASEAS